MSEKFGIFEKFADGKNGVWDRYCCTGGAKFAKTFAIFARGKNSTPLTKTYFFKGVNYLRMAGWLAGLGWAGWLGWLVQWVVILYFP